tara:strand:+ start:1824 stop:2048 length:225 start_codon:yes stop_codon:yes gene_type:complete
MKVSQVIRILTDNYESDDNIIIDWIGHEMYDEETDENLWNKVVTSIEMNNKLEYAYEEMHDIINEVILEKKGEI